MCVCVCLRCQSEPGIMWSTDLIIPLISVCLTFQCKTSEGDRNHTHSHTHTGLIRTPHWLKFTRTAAAEPCSWPLSIIHIFNLTCEMRPFYQAPETSGRQSIVITVWACVSGWLPVPVCSTCCTKVLCHWCIFKRLQHVNRCSFGYCSLF